ncbi:MAG TPA: LysR substrate-binding domain-containing protein [Archangium sp.]|uniref:LysR family transcriptional regulator n=1 Tax=Archangium sp. TaxID=1872627 RepID=UPI002E350E27|nr:LysR substrate-binding domain-containing protein [Archangium sp.]HEX5748846.1 LysR substrate-binding domain-containing protein [Archangium sp.]
MNVFECMRAFRAVAEVGSFAGAGRSLRITTAWVSARVAQLEEHLGVQLLVRTTRRVALTDAGRVYLARCAQLLDDLEEAERSVIDLESSPRGRLRITAPMSFGLVRVAPLLAPFMAACPEVRLDVVFNDRFVDLLEEGFDVAVRIAASLDDSSLVARKLATGARVLCASPGYLRKRGSPKHPRELAAHNCLTYALHATPGKWEFTGPTGHEAVSVRGPLQLNNSIALCTAAEGGAGILLAPDFVVAESLQRGRLERVLGEYHPSGYQVFAVSPPTRFAAPRTRAFVDFLSRKLR